MDSSLSSRGAVRRAIEGCTFAPDERGDRANVHLIDDQAARYGAFDDMVVVGLIENDWPEAGASQHLLPAGPVEGAGMAF